MFLLYNEISHLEDIEKRKKTRSFACCLFFMIMLMNITVYPKDFPLSLFQIQHDQEVFGIFQFLSL